METTQAEMVKAAYADHPTLKYSTGDTICQEDILTVASQFIGKILAPYITGEKVIIPDDKVDSVKQDMRIALSRAIRIAVTGSDF